MSANSKTGRCCSFLNVPGSQPDRFSKAFGSGADAVFIDLGDAVAPDAKEQARRAVAAWVTPDRNTYLRVNANGTPWFSEDTQLGKLPGVGGIILPKAGSVLGQTGARRFGEGERSGHRGRWQDGRRPVVLCAKRKLI
jgi:citrate lyase beta subunit